jgi:hypothetical protein
MDIRMTHPNASNIWIWFEPALEDAANDTIWDRVSSILHGAVQLYRMKTLALLYLTKDG